MLFLCILRRTCSITSGVRLTQHLGQAHILHSHTREQKRLPKYGIHLRRSPVEPITHLGVLRPSTADCSQGVSGSSGAAIPPEDGSSLLHLGRAVASVRKWATYRPLCSEHLKQNSGSRNTHHLSLISFNHSFFFLHFYPCSRTFFFHCSLRQWKGERKGVRETSMWERDIDWLPPVDAWTGDHTHPDQGLDPQPRYVPWPGIEPTTSWLWDRQPSNQHTGQVPLIPLVANTP